ncbi:MAG TPA: glycerol-3-phosphate dehydrogenase subunit GlpB [Actinomycetota bacterium]|nr:glycerol-3-phosphate dehydrogenase subunit GlpB [Actinomycetota bacterium]
MRDVVVIGAGVAGLTAAIRLAEAGLSVEVVAKGVGATHLTAATVDVLGYAPGRVDSPADALPAFVRDRPEHPYARLGPERIAEALDWFRGRVAALGYGGDLRRNLLLPTALGVPRPTALAPETMAEGDLRGGGRILVVGFRALKDLHPGLLAENLRRADVPGGPVEARAVEVAPDLGAADLNAVALARRMEEPEVRKEVLRELEPAVADAERVAFPAVLGLDDAPGIWAELRAALGRPVFEVPTLPPSVPGIRLFRALRAALRRAGGRLTMGAEVEGAETGGGRVAAVITRTGSRAVRHGARWFVLATGGVGGGGVASDSTGAFRETVLGLPVRFLPEDGPPFLPGYLDAHPAARAGVAVDERMRPLGRDDAPAFENVVAAGATIGGAEPWREKSGEGISIATGYAAAGTVLEEAG